MADIHLLDAGLALTLVLFSIRGFLRGMVRELAGLVGVFLGFFIAGRYYPKAIPFVQKVVTEPGWVNIAAYALVFALVLVGVALLAYALRTFMTLTFTAWLDYVLGGVVGASKGLLLCAVALALLGRFVPNSPLLKTSQLAGHIDVVTTFVRSMIPVFIHI